MELYNASTMPLSNNPELRNAQEKLLNGEPLSIREKVIVGGDHTIKKLADYELKPDCCYRAVSDKTFRRYLESGFILGSSPTDEYISGVNNKGVNWYLGGACLKYGDIILECPAYVNYFTPAFDNGSGMSYDPTVRFFKSSGAKNPIPMAMITNVFDVKGLKKQENKNNLEPTVKIIELDRSKMMQLLQQRFDDSNVDNIKLGR